MLLVGASFFLHVVCLLYAQVFNGSAGRLDWPEAVGPVRQSFIGRVPWPAYACYSGLVWYKCHPGPFESLNVAFGCVLLGVLLMKTFGVLVLLPYFIKRYGSVYLCA